MTKRGFYSDNSNSTIDWLEQFAEDYSKQAYPTDNSQNYYDQIAAIVGGKKSFNTVQEKVNDYAARLGLDKVSKDTESLDNIKNAVLQFNNILQNNPVLKEKVFNFIKNKIESFHGNITIPALQYELIRNFKNDGLTNNDIHDENFIKYISHLLLESQSRYPKIQTNNNLGQSETNVENDPANTDYFHGLQTKS